MSRSIRIELSPRNVSLLLGALGLFAVLVAAAVRLWGGPADAHVENAEHAEHDHAAGESAGDHEQEREGHVSLSPQALVNAGIEVAAAGPGDVNVTLSLPGEVSLNQESLAHVTPRVAGAAREVRKQVGELVEKGDVLAIIDSRDLAEVQREFLAAKERLALAEATFQRAELLKKENISAEKDYLAVRQALAEAKIEHRSAAQKLQAIGGGAAGGGGYALVAPLTGTIIEKHINVGEVLSQETPTFTIADLSSIWVNVTVYARDLPRVAVGQAVEVRAEGIVEPARGNIAYLG
ncbi:MAG TPA: efflux RND transporter periplasmic adaptor subunit, partial [Polyangiaceae bacterium]|nr:efflux RND transporter periplasmic adaptor subunit [Polyangiaceae bacterium]